MAAKLNKCTLRSRLLVSRWIRGILQQVRWVWKVNWDTNCSWNTQIESILLTILNDPNSKRVSKYKIEYWFVALDFSLWKTYWRWSFLALTIGWTAEALSDAPRQSQLCRTNLGLRPTLAWKRGIPQFLHGCLEANRWKEWAWYFLCYLWIWTSTVHDGSSRYLRRRHRPQWN